MENFDYVVQANVTASSQFHGAEIDNDVAMKIVSNAIIALEQLDGLKKAFFYGRNVEAYGPEEGSNFAAPKASFWATALCNDDPEKGEALLHAAIGIATEGGELLEAILSAITNDALDEVNFSEELGDVLWYNALAIKALGTSFDKVQRTNIAKLRARYPEKFTEHNANNRDLFAERKILEGKL